MRKGILGLAAGLALAGCAAVETPLDDGYQFGDLTASAITLQAAYCAESDPRERAFRLAILRAAGVPIPPSGACRDIIELAPEVDMEEAEADRERFNPN